MSRTSSPATGTKRHEARVANQAPQPFGHDRLGSQIHRPRRKHHIAKPTWNRGKGTFERKADAQRAIEEAYGISEKPDTLGDYAATWTERHPRAERTNATYDHRISRVLDVEIEGIPLKDWPLHELRRRHTLALVDHMLRNEGRATTGAVGILRALLAMAEDAITDEVCDLNPFKGIRIRANDPRARKKPRPIRVFTFEEMHRPHECRHSYVTHLRAEGINDADLAEVVGHRVETMLARYTHAVGGSFQKVRAIIG